LSCGGEKHVVECCVAGAENFFLHDRHATGSIGTSGHGFKLHPGLDREWGATEIERRGVGDLNIVFRTALEVERAGIWPSAKT